MSKTQPARGMRDFLPADVRKRNYVIGIIKEVYEKYGFEPLETPSVENLETLTGKYGEEGNQLMFKILKRGEKLQEELATGKITSENDLSDLALRYDLTVPLARVVANYRHELPKFFKRYQIQPVWRADRPAKGRYREFYQCDVDAIGSTSMLVEAEIISAVSEIFERLGFVDFTIRLNHRGLLTSVLRYAFQWGNISEDKTAEVLITLDKLDKIGKTGVSEELKEKGLSEESIDWLLAVFKRTESFIPEDDDGRWFVNLLTLEYVFSFVGGQWELYEDKESMFSKFNESSVSEFKDFIESGYDKKKKRHLINLVKGNEVATKAVKDLYEILSLTNNFNISIDASLARGLSYYTGAIFEVNIADFAGSLAGGGRYDGLIGMFGKEQIPAVGFSIGLERILFVMEEREMFPENLTANPADVMITLWNEDAAGESLKLAGELRNEGLRVLVYPEADKLGKQFKYADSLGIPFVCVLGETELAENKVTLKNMKTGEQETVLREDVFEKTKK